MLYKVLSTAYSYRPCEKNTNNLANANIAWLKRLFIHWCFSFCDTSELAADQNPTRKLYSINDKAPTDRVNYCISTFDLDFRSLALTSDLQLQSQQSYRYDPYACKKVMAKGHSVQKLRMERDGRTDGRRRSIISTLFDAVRVDRERPCLSIHCCGRHYQYVIQTPLGGVDPPDFR